MARVRVLSALFALALVVPLQSCNSVRVRLPVRGDAGDRDADNDETLIPCDNASMCPGREERLCGPLGFCVECITTADCPDGEVCESDDGECDRPRARN